MPYPIYATKEELANYLGLENIDQLLEDAERLLKRASELVYSLSYGNIINTNENHLEALKLATCAQVEYWNEISEQSAIVGQKVNSFSIGDISMNFGNDMSLGDQSNSKVAPRASRYLNDQGLMYRGLR